MDFSRDWNYYEILEVAPHASQNEIQRAYLRARDTYSLTNPELFKIFSEQEATAWIGLIEEAYSTIGHPKSRELYNRKLNLKRGVAEGQLPSFQLESPQPVEAVPSEDIEPPADPNIPHGKTKLSVYPIDKQMEELILKQEIFDGLFLKKVRIYKNVELQEFSRMTCIAIRHLYAIENNNFSVLPASVFVRGYILQYAKILGLDEEKVVGSFMSLLANERN